MLRGEAFIITGVEPNARAALEEAIEARGGKLLKEEDLQPEGLSVACVSAGGHFRSARVPAELQAKPFERSRSAQNVTHTPLCPCSERRPIPCCLFLGEQRLLDGGHVTLVCGELKRTLKVGGEA